MTGVSVSAHDGGRGWKGSHAVNRAAAAQSVGWVIWPGPGRGYIALGDDLLLIADVLEALWFLRAQRHEMDMLPAARGGVL